MRLEDHVAALAALGTEHDDELAAATRLRIRASLERGHAWRRHASTLAALAILLVASGAWALATGRLQRWVGSAHVVPAPRPVSTVPQAPAIPRAPAPAAVVAPAPIAAPAPVAIVPPASAVAAPVPHVPSTPTAPPSSPPAHLHATRSTSEPPPTAEAIAPAEDALYARAHELHFRAGAPAGALAAWDAYLAAAPHGAFAIEARYNRALCLVRLGRLAEARTALEPFARGAIEPAGYRQSDAAHLIDRIDHRLNGSR